jgi:hypothetical protein
MYQPPVLQIFPFPIQYDSIGINLTYSVFLSIVNLATGGEDLAESRNMMRIFDMAFKRLISTSFEADDDLKEVKEFYDNIWSIHNDGEWILFYRTLARRADQADVAFPQIPKSHIPFN